jgi:hypothetical protein
MQTNYQDAVSHFAGRSTAARSRLASWRADPHKRDVVAFVESAVTRVPYRLSPADVERICQSTTHALGNVTRRDAESVQEIVDWHPAFAFEHALHHTTESLGEVPTYQAFREFCRLNALAREMLLVPAKAQVRVAEQAGHAPEIARAAMRWRIGNAYLSYLREQYVIAVLREQGWDVRCHVLADVLFRVDCWVDDVCVGIYVRNMKFRAGRAGRKPLANAVLDQGPFRFVDLELSPRREFGTVHLPDRGAITRAAQSITP